MKPHLKGRVALVTGGSKGIGQSIAKALVEEGAHVSITARGKEGLNKVGCEMHSNVLTISADATDEKAVDSAIRRTIDAFGQLDILVNNVGGAGRFGGFGDLTDDDWRNAFDLNVLSLVHYVRAAESHLRKSKAGRIINISSISGVQPGRFNPHYAVTKAATINLSKFLSDYFAAAGVLVNVVCPGPVHSNSWDENVVRLAAQRGITVEDARRQVEHDESAKIPLGRVGEGEDIAGLVAFLASDKARWITGSCLHANGGKLRTIW